MKTWRPIVQRGFDQSRFCCSGLGRRVTVVDSSVRIEFFNGVSTPEVDRLDGLLGVTPVAIGDLILVEVV